MTLVFLVLLSLNNECKNRVSYVLSLVLLVMFLGQGADMPTWQSQYHHIFYVLILSVKSKSSSNGQD